MERFSAILAALVLLGVLALASGGKITPSGDPLPCPRTGCIVCPPEGCH